MSDIKATVIEMAHHRNGIAGDPFYVVRIKDEENGEMVVIRFVPTKDIGGNGMHCAVLNVAQLAKGDIAMGSNSWRGDQYAPIVDRAIQQQELSDEMKHWDDAQLRDEHKSASEELVMSRAWNGYRDNLGYRVEIMMRELARRVDATNQSKRNNIALEMAGTKETYRELINQSVDKGVKAYRAALAHVRKIAKGESIEAQLAREVLDEHDEEVAALAEDFQTEQGGR